MMTYDGTTEDLLKTNRKLSSRGALTRVATGGGGGYSDSAERDPIDHQQDVIEGYVTA